MPVAHILDLIDGGDLADLPPLDQIFQGHVKRRVAQHVAHRQISSGPLGGVRNQAALILGVAHGLFQQEMVPQLHSPERGGRVVIVQGANEGAVRHPRLRQKLLPGGKAILLRDAQLLGKQIAPVLPGLCHGDDLKLIGMLLCVERVGASPASGTQNNCSDRFHGVPSHYVLFLELYRIFPGKSTDRSRKAAVPVQPKGCGPRLSKNLRSWLSLWGSCHAPA